MGPKYQKSHTPVAPHIPPQILESTKDDPAFDQFQSKIFTPDFNIMRHNICAHRISTETYVTMSSSSGPAIGFRSKDQRTMLHLAAKNGDLLLAYEIIRLGATIDILDAEGASPLFLACETLAQWKGIKNIAKSDRNALRNVKLTSKQVDDMVARIIRVSKILVEQHADVNLVKKGQTPFLLVCRAEAWDLISVFLSHGANLRPHNLPSAESVFLSPSSRAQFKSLVQANGQFVRRPSRVCPCWSGLLLENCHDTEEHRPYPPEFLCPCGSDKTYERCCLKRSIEITEKWNSDEQWIQHVEVRRVSLPAGHGGGLHDSLNSARDNMASGVLDPESVLAGTIQLKNDMADILLHQGDIDPAFAAALKVVDFFPKPWGRLLSRPESRKRADEWNAAVDTYLASGVDRRPVETMGQAAKIGPTGGPLYRIREGTGCDKVENRDVEKLLICSACKMAVYCSKDCQRTAWAAHKTVCGKLGQTEQALPSQGAMIAWQAEKLKLFDIDMDGMVQKFDDASILTLNGTNLAFLPQIYYLC